MKLIQERCTGCAYCVLICPYEAIASDGWADVSAGCYLCYYVYPND